MLPRWLIRSQLCSRPQGTRFYRTKGSKNRKTLEREAVEEEDALGFREAQKSREARGRRGLRAQSPASDPAGHRHFSKETAIIGHGSRKHRDLKSFIAYATQNRVDPTTATYRGTYYEYMVQSSLERMGFDIQRQGRKGDLGIDLMGWWNLPGSPTDAKPIKVLLQCKAFSEKIGPRYIRELEGSFTGAPHRWRGDGIFGFLVATCEATKGMREAMIASQLPLGFMQVTIKGKILQMLWNYKANLWGLEGYGVATRFGSRPAEDQDAYNVELDELDKEVVLTKNGEAIDVDQPDKF